MKVQCDVCAAEAAEVYCCADEAALCDRCDRHVHRANRLAGKHHRFSLLHPSSSAQSPPLCDVCKVGEEGAALLPGGPRDLVQGLRRPDPQRHRAHHEAQQVPPYRPQRLGRSAPAVAVRGGRGGGLSARQRREGQEQQQQQLSHHGGNHEQQQQQHLRVPDQDAAGVARRGLPDRRRCRACLVQDGGRGGGRAAVWIERHWWGSSSSSSPALVLRRRGNRAGAGGVEGKQPQQEAEDISKVPVANV